jgi:ABC-type sugar transport system substrate-binding protein
MPTRHVVVLLPDSRNPYMQLSAEAASRSAERLRLTLDIQFAEADFTTQVRQLYLATREVPRPDFVMVTPVQEAALKTLSEQTVAAGIGWFWMNRSVGNERELRARFPEIPVCLVSPDQREAGRIQARQARSLLTQTGRVLFVQGRMTNQSARLRAEAFREALKRYPGLEVIGELDGNWSAEGAKLAVTRWLDVMRPTPLRPDVVICQNDAMAGGVLDALSDVAKKAGEPELAKLPVIGADGLHALGRHMVDIGKLAATTLLPITADRALQAAAAFLDNGDMPPAEIILPPAAYPDEATMVRRWRRTA